jgi:short-subunit dehydrogenase
MWLIARRKERLEELAIQLNSISKDTSIRCIQGDLAGNSGVEFVKNLFQEEQNQQEFIIDTLVNNAGYGTYGTFEDTSLERQLGMIDLNVYSLTGICYASLPYLQKGSLVINVASLASFAPLGNFAVYGATKAYVYSFSLALAAELEPKGIFVETLCPGPVDTEFANVASLGARKVVKDGKSPEKVVAHCLKCVSQKRYISIMALKWKFKAFMSRFISKIWFARYTYKHEKRPSN